MEIISNFIKPVDHSKNHICIVRIEINKEMVEISAFPTCSVKVSSAWMGSI
jgi:hypothetical protein